jgi:hypothetical protein
MSTRTYCDCCGRTLGTAQTPNWWHANLMGDTLRASDGRMIESSGLTVRTANDRFAPINKADLCIPCMAKTQEEAM